MEYPSSRAHIEVGTVDHPDWRLISRTSGSKTLFPPLVVCTTAIQILGTPRCQTNLILPAIAARAATCGVPSVQVRATKAGTLKDELKHGEA